MHFIKSSSISNFFAQVQADCSDKFSTPFSPTHAINSITF